MASEDVKYEHLVTTYAAQHASLVEALLKALLKLWMPFLWWGRPDMVNAAAAASAAQVDAVSQRARRLSRAFMLRQLALMDAAPDTLPPIVDTYERGETMIVEVYKRPARQLEHLIREDIRKKQKDTGKTVPWPERITDEQMQSFEDRLTSLVTDDLAATARDEAQKVMRSAQKVIGYRRLIHPELSKTGTCGLCVVASTRFYTLSELLPLHDKCKCTISPVTKTQDLGLKLNEDDLARIYEAAGSTYAEDLKRLTIEIREHSELGPILTRKGDAFRDRADANRTSKRVQYKPHRQMTAADETRKWTAMRATSERSIAILEDAKRSNTNLVDMTGSGELIPVKDINKAIEWHRSLITRATAHLS